MTEIISQGDMEGYNPSMIEENHLQVLKLCSILDKIETQERKYARAQYRVSYFKKIRQALATTTQRKPLPDGYLKWKDCPKELEAQIEETRLAVLREQERTLTLHREVHDSLTDALLAVDAAVTFQEGKTLGVIIGSRAKGHFIPVEKFAELADQYEATVAMNKVLNN